MHDGRPNPDVWGSLITCAEIGLGIYEIAGRRKSGLSIPKEIAEEVLPESVLTQAEPDGDDLCFTDPLATAIAADELIKQEIATDPEALSQLKRLNQLEDIELDTEFEEICEEVGEFELDR